MKKIIAILALSLLAAPAFAGIQSTKHDLSDANGGFDGTGTITEICVYCHTPHAADTSVTIAPLWNRVNPALTTLTLYTGLDLNATAFGYNEANVRQSDAPLCLSCHDGTSLSTDLVNMPNSGGNVPGDITNANALIGTDLSDDHPIGFNYSQTATADGELHDPPNNSLPLFGGKMWCSSCHDVHDNTKGTPFLQYTNLNSALCLSCHIK